MANLPQHPYSDDPETTPSRDGPRWTGRAARLFVILVVLAAFVVLHLTGTLGPGGHR